MKDSPTAGIANLYVHFPFCRSKCSYCSLYSRVGVSASAREAYVAGLARELSAAKARLMPKLATIYFGGGSPALCCLHPLRAELASLCDQSTEFTVELHPLDVTEEKLRELRDLGVTRISMGVQSLDDAILVAMGRGYSFQDAEQAFALVKRYFDNAGIDLIVGYPGEDSALAPRHARLAKWGLRHCSVYALQNERGLRGVPDDDTMLNRLDIMAEFLADLGFRRYEISNYAIPGFECRHNLAVWRGEDYVGLGEGACGREKLLRTRGLKEGRYSTETVSLVSDAKERTLFRLRTREGLDALRHPEWLPVLDRLVVDGLLTRTADTYFLTHRGTEVCDSILAELV